MEFTLTDQIKIIIFILTSIWIIWLTRSTFRNIRSHGFYRLFVWESILIMILLNIDYWFHEPFSSYQILSWLFLIICTYWVVHGIHSLHKMGKPSKDRIDPSLFGLEKTTELVRVGAFRYIRHPLYSSLLFLNWGVFFKQPSLTCLSLAVIATIFLILTAKTEEAENIRYFGDNYVSYMKQTKMFIPFLF